MDRAAEASGIALLKARYFRLLDTKQWPAWRTLFTDDMEFFVDRESPVPVATTPISSGGDAFVEHVSRLLATSVTVHHGHMPEIEFEDEGTARGIWAMFDLVEDVSARKALAGYGHYHERYVKGPDGAWRIRRLHLTRLRVDEVPALHFGSVRSPEPWNRPSG
jgi:hypothetical protein